MRTGLGRVAERHGPGLHLDVDFGVDVGGIEAGMTEPRADRVQIDSGLEEWQALV